MDKQAASRIMATTGWLSRQPEAFRTELLKRSFYRHHHAGKVLYDIGDPPSGVFGLVEGTLDVRLPNGHIGTVASPGFWIGEGAAFDRTPRRVALVARSPVRVFYLPLHEFDAMIGNSEYCRSFAILTIEHFEDALRVVASLLPSDVTARVGARLLSLSHAGTGDGQVLSVTQSDLASMCGLTRQSVNRAIRRLVAECAISSRYGKVTVIDAGKLRQVAADGGDGVLPRFPETAGARSPEP
jgi:CRP-like cAMP-binding protein